MCTVRGENVCNGVGMCVCVCIDSDGDIIAAEGIMQFCQDLGVEPADVVMVSMTHTHTHTYTDTQP